MTFYLEYVFAAVLYTECFTGILVNVIILAAIFLKWKTLRSVQTYYKILSCLLLSRSFYFLSVFFLYVVFVFYPWLLLDAVFLVSVNIEIMFMYYTNLWIATVLCVFYCVKITSYNWKVLIFLKTKISAGVSWLLPASLIFSFSSSLFFSFYYLEPQDLRNSTMENVTVYNDVPNISMQKIFLTFLLGSCPPLLIMCVTICLLLHSLWMHTRRMRSSGSTFGSPNLETHFSAVKSVSFFLGLQIVYFVVMNVIISGRIHHGMISRLVTSMITCSPQFFHSLHIISSNRDMKKTCISMFRALTRRA